MQRGLIREEVLPEALRARYNSNEVLIIATSGPGALRKFTVLRGDKPKTGPTWNFPDSQLVALITGQQTEGKLVVFEQTMAPNGWVPLHINHREDESFYLVEGKYLFEVGGVLEELGPASHVFVTRGVPHRFRCTERGKMLMVCQPAEWSRPSTS